MVEIQLAHAIDAYLSRSRVESFNACPRRGYYEYMFAGIGLSVDPGAIYFDTGNSVHAGQAACLRFIQQGVKVPERKHITTAVQTAITEFDRRSGNNDANRLTPHIWHLETEYRKEQRDLAAALVYTWIVEEWESFAHRFEVLAVELDTHFTNRVGGLTIHWESKADAIVREILPPHAISVISWKTAQNTTEWTRRKYRSDLQGYLECWFAQQHTGLTIDYNQVIYLVKGKKLRMGHAGIELPWNADVNEITRYSTDSFLLNPYFKPRDHPAPFFNELEGIVPDTIWSPSYRKPGNLTDSQFKSWNRLDRFKLEDLDENGWPLLFTWVDSLKANKIFPTYEFTGGAGPLGRIIVWEDQSARNNDLAAELLKEISFATLRYSTHGELSDRADSPDVVFPRDLQTCYDGPPDALGRTGCPYPEICKGAGQIIPTSELFDPRDDPPPAGFIWRKPHHLEEAKALSERQ